jgi:hypothetical protein
MKLLKTTLTAVAIVVASGCDARKPVAKAGDGDGAAPKPALPATGGFSRELLIGDWTRQSVGTNGSLATVTRTYGADGRYSGVLLHKAGSGKTYRMTEKSTWWIEGDRLMAKSENTTPSKPDVEKEDISVKILELSRIRLVYERPNGKKVEMTRTK